jgi:hypothetical protein
MRNTHDNENDTWSTLGLAAARVLERCEEQKKDRERNAQQDSDHEEDAEQQRKRINKRLLYAGIKGRP